MNYSEEMLRLRTQQVIALQNKVQELTAKVEVTQKQLETYVND